MKFKIGDRVYNHTYGQGVINELSDCGTFYAVNFDKKHDKLHTCDGYCGHKRGWWCHAKELNLVCDDALNIGDEVVYIYQGMELLGTIRDIVENECVDMNFYEYAVEFNKHCPDFHDCDGVCVEGYGWWCFAGELKKVKKIETIKTQTRRVYCRTLPYYVSDDVEKLIINEPYVIVELESGEIGNAKCHVDDEFDEEIGFKIAYRRAMISKHKNDKIRMIESIEKEFNEKIEVLQGEIDYFKIDSSVFELL